MNAAHVREALHSKWPAGQFVTIEEAPDGPDRMGRKLDVLAISCWRSRGYQLDGVEIKVSMSDWRKELATPAKADFWWRHCHRFWLAVPSEMAAKVRDELPGEWGLLSVTEAGGVRAVVTAPVHKPEPLTWPQVVGLLRATEGAGLNALERQFNMGIDEGIKRQRARLDRESGDVHLRSRIDLLEGKINAFTEASGIDIGKMYNSDAAARAGALFAAVRSQHLDPERHKSRIADASRDLREEADRLDRVADACGRVWSEGLVST